MQTFKYYKRYINNYTSKTCAKEKTIFPRKKHFGKKRNMTEDIENIKNI